MSRKAKYSAEEKLKVVELYLSGEIGYTAAYTSIGTNSKTWRGWLMRYKKEGASGLITREKNNHYTKETKLSATIEFLTGKVSASEICIKYKISDESVLKSWIKVYSSHEEFRIFSGGSRMTKGRKTTPAERIMIAKECISNNNNYGEIALKYQVSYQQVHGWVKRYRAMGDAGLEDRRGRRTGTLPSRTPDEELRDRIAQLEREKLDLEMENALLKKVKELERRRR